LLIAESVDAINCYACSSVDTTECGDPFTNGTQKFGCAACLKVKSELVGTTSEDCHLFFEDTNLWIDIHSFLIREIISHFLNILSWDPICRLCFSNIAHYPRGTICGKIMFTNKQFKECYNVQDNYSITSNGIEQFYFVLKQISTPINFQSFIIMYLHPQYKLKLKVNYMYKYTLVHVKYTFYLIPFYFYIFYFFSMNIYGS